MAHKQVLFRSAARERVLGLPAGDRFWLAADSLESERRCDGITR
jgi:hypothetical protein